MPTPTSDENRKTVMLALSKTSRPMVVRRFHAVQEWMKSQHLFASDDKQSPRVFAYAILAKAHCNVIRVARLKDCAKPVGDWLALLALISVDMSEETRLALVTLADDATADMLNRGSMMELDREWRKACGCL